MFEITEILKYFAPGTPAFNIIGLIIVVIAYSVFSPLVKGWVQNRQTKDDQWHTLAQQLEAQIHEIRDIQVGDLKTRVDNVEKESDDWQKKYTAMNTRYMAAFAVADQQKQIIAELEATVAHLKSQYVAVFAVADQQKQIISELKATVAHLKSQIALLQKEINPTE